MQTPGRLSSNQIRLVVASIQSALAFMMVEEYLIISCFESLAMIETVSPLVHATISNHQPNQERAHAVRGVDAV